MDQTFKGRSRCLDIQKWNQRHAVYWNCNSGQPNRRRQYLGFCNGRQVIRYSWHQSPFPKLSKKWPVVHSAQKERWLSHGVPACASGISTGRKQACIGIDFQDTEHTRNKTSNRFTEGFTPFYSRWNFRWFFQAFDKAGDQYRLACHEYAHKIMTLSMKVSFGHAATQQFTLVSKWFSCFEWRIVAPCANLGAVPSCNSALASDRDSEGVNLPTVCESKIEALSTPIPSLHNLKSCFITGCHYER